MAAAGTIRAAIFTVFLGWFYQAYLHQFVVLVGINREIRPLSDFPFECRRVNDPDFEACEDMWYDDTTKLLYLACSTTKTRKQWNPNMGILNAPKTDADQRVVVVDTTKPTGDTYLHHKLKIKNLKSSLFTLSITGMKDSKKLKFYMVNNKPTLDADNSVTGANESIELFEHESGSSDLVHVRTFEHALIMTPNNIAPTADGGFFFTNDAGPHKTGTMKKLAPYLHAGSIGHCNAGTPTDCAIVNTLHSFPNGIVIPTNHPNLLFVGSAALGRAVRIYEIIPAKPLAAGQSQTQTPSHPTLRLRHKVPVDLPLDNLRYDEATKSIYAPGFPSMFATIDKMTNLTYEHQIAAPSRVLRIFEEKNLVDGSRWVAETVLEDPSGDVLPDTTTAVRDGKGAIWLSSVVSPFLTVCEPKRIAAAR